MTVPDAEQAPSTFDLDPHEQHEWLHYDKDFHGYLTPAGAFARRPHVTLGILAALAILAGVASIDEGTILDTWDIPIQEWVEGHRTSVLDPFFRTVSSVGANAFVFPFAAVLAVIAWIRCRPLAIAVVVAVALRPIFGTLVKELVARPRPALDPIAEAASFSHPSGHVLSTVVLYSLVPAVVAVHLGRHKVWRVTWAIVSLVPLTMVASRVYLGVHWFTDAAAGLFWGVVYLALVGMIFDRYHIGRCGFHNAHWRDHADESHRLRRPV